LLDVYDTLHPLATLTISGQITLDKLLHVLGRDHPAASAQLGKLLKKEGDRYCSEYRRYVGEQQFEGGMNHYFTAGITKLVIDNDFCVSPG
jgi:hypothetical protein